MMKRILLFAKAAAIAAALAALTFILCACNRLSPEKPNGSYTNYSSVSEENDSQATSQSSGRIVLPPDKFD